MNAHVRRWGNSAAVRIPAALLESVGLKADDPIDVREEGGRIVIERPARKVVDLKALVDAITPENRHEEIDWGPPQGKEVW